MKDSASELAKQSMKKIKPTMRIADSSAALEAMDALFKAKFKSLTKTKPEAEAVRKCRMIVLALLDGITEMIPHDDSEDSLVVLESMRDLIGALGITVKNWNATLGIQVLDVDKRKAIALDKYLKMGNRKALRK